MAYSHILGLTVIASMCVSFVAANILLIKQYETNAHEYYCDPNESCTISCLSTAACYKSTLYCPSDHDCDIVCDPSDEYGSNACSESVIHAEYSTHLSITVTAHPSNAQSMTIYTPYPDSSNKQQSILICHSSESTLDQCSDLRIHATQGFNDITLMCNDATSLCDISGSITCAYNRYTSEDHDSNNENECTQFAFNTEQSSYECLNSGICLDSDTNTNRVANSISTTSSSRVALPLNTNAPTALTLAPTPMPDSIYTQQQIIGVNSSDIHTLVLVLVGTSTVTCVILIIFAVCGLIYIRFNKEDVENILIRRYLEGRGASPHYKGTDAGSDDTSNDGSTYVSGCTDTHHEVGSEDSTDLGLVALDSNKGKLSTATTVPEYPNILFEDEFEHIINDTECVHINICTQQKDMDDNDNDLQLVSEPSNGVPSINADASSAQEDTLSPASHSNHSDDIHIVLPCTNRVPNDTNAVPHDIELRDGYPQMPSPLHTPPLIIGPDLTPKQLQQRAQIHLENLRNRARCFGYIQPDILYEVSENFSSNSDEEQRGDEVKMDQKQKNAHKNVEGSESDDLLYDGMIETIQTNDNEQMEMKIGTFLAAPRSVPSRKDPEILSDDGQLPSLPMFC